MSKKGFTFIGWSSTKSGLVALPEFLTPTSNTTLYAIWELTPTPVVTSAPRPTPTQEPVRNPQPKPEMTKVGTVYMANGSYFLNDATKRTLTALAKQINASGAKSILVYGHTDNRGGVNNTVLSQNRAKAVARYLRPLLNTKKISIGWFASRKPVATGNSEADLALNRRVEIYSQ
jgi:peptidoglycan-associated lipoprotein